MFSTVYENMLEAEKEEFKRVANYILSHTFVLKDNYDRVKNVFVVSNEYRFLEKYFDCFEEYFNYSGWQISKDFINSVIYISNRYEYNKAKLDSFTTYMLLALKYLFDEIGSSASASNSVTTTVMAVVTQMQAFGLLQKKPTKELIKSGVRRLEAFNIIERITTGQDVEKWKILIRPSIDVILSNEKLNSILYGLGEEENSEEEIKQQVIDNVNNILQLDEEEKEELIDNSKQSNISLPNIPYQQSAPKANQYGYDPFEEEENDKNLIDLDEED